MVYNDEPFLSFPRLRLERPVVAIVGGGAGGVLTAIHLLRSRAPVRIVLIGSPEPCLDEEVAAARRRTPFTAIRGRVTGIATGPGGAGLRLRSGDTLWASQVVLALGASPEGEGDPLLDGLVAGGDARPGPGGSGLAVDGDGRVLDRAGEPSDTLWAIGPAPDTGDQAAALARLVPAAALALEISYALEEVH